jgi:hypothetical protein
MYAFFSDTAAKVVPILHVWMIAFVGLVAFGAAGSAAITFLSDRRVSMMAAPLAGIALWPLATLALYAGAPLEIKLSFDSAARFAWVALVLLSCLLIWLNGVSFAAAWRSLATIAAVSLIIAPIVMVAWVDRGEPALLLVAGADHPSYAAMADWYRSHSPQMVIDGIVGPAVPDPKQPYINFAELVLTADVRGGAFAYLALVSMLSGQPALFCFDAAVAIALIAACLGCAAVFSRSWTALLCLAAALFTSLWYDYGHMGSFGKLLSYPLVLFAFGLFVSFQRSKAGPAEVLILSMLAAGTALMHNAVVFGLLFSCLAASLLLATALIDRKPPSIADCALAACPPLVAMIASGTLARPLNALVYGDFGLSWRGIAYLLTDLNSLYADVAWVPGRVLFALWLVCMAAWATLIVIATAKRNASALALLCGPVAVVLILYALNQARAAVQLGGFPYPAALCAGFLLVQQREQAGRSAVGLRDALVPAILVVLVLAHVPRLIGSVTHYARDSDRRQMFAVSDFDRLQAAIGDREVYVDVRGNIRNVFPIMVEFGRRNLRSVWSPDSWHFAGAFRGSPVPTVEKIPVLRLIDATEQANARERVIVETRRYKLLGPSE